LNNINIMENNDMTVVKRNGELEDVAFDKILNRIRRIGTEVGIQINYTSLAMKVIDQLYNKITTTQLDELTAEQCAALSATHPDYYTLAGRIIISNNHKNTEGSFTNVMNQFYDANMISPYTWESIRKNSEELEKIIDYQRDYLIDYFGFKTLERSYLFRINGIIIERPQHMWLRVSVGIHGTDIALIKETYDLMSQKYFTHATPTLFNAGTNRNQLSSCYLIGMEDDSLEGIFGTLKDCAQISKWAGGIGLHIHNIRATNSVIHGTNGKSTGIVPMLKVFNDTARYVNQGGKRNGSFAVYLEPWHADIEQFLDLRKNHGDEEQRARDLFYALWIPDLFMECVKENLQWCLFCPNECPGLSDVHSCEFVALYRKYESEGRQRKTVSARELWFKILDSQMETGTPYLLYKDACNQKSNQKNLGTIKSSNLCTEVVQYSDAHETSVCNLASIALPTFVDTKTKEFDYEKLHKVTKVITRNLNKIIDINFYPTEKTRKSNLLHRPIGIGVQGLADTFILMDIAYCSEEAKTVNKQIFETIYHAALECSNEIAKKIKDDYNSNQNPKYFETTNLVSDLSLRYSLSLKHRGAYMSFEGSPASQGILQFDMWNVIPSDRYDWSTLKQSIVDHGLRNSLLLAPMPTASTSQILGFNECFEPLTSNIYTRRTLAGEFIVTNRYLMRELIDLGLWNDKIKNNIIANKGSIQQLTMLSEHMRNKYKIVWEIPMKQLIDMSADRGAFICQSQSLNLWQEDPTYNSLTSMHFYSWKKGLKTGIYYLRRKAKHQAQQFTIEPENKMTEKKEKEDEICEMCSA